MSSETDLNIREIIEAIKATRIRISDHADEETREDGLTLEEVYDSVFRGEIIEDYPDDEPYPSCLIYGAIKGKPVHSVWSYHAQNRSTVLVTVYRPDPKRWINWKERRKAK